MFLSHRSDTGTATFVMEMSDIGASQDIIDRLDALTQTLETLSEDVAICDVTLGLELDDE